VVDEPARTGPTEDHAALTVVVGVFPKDDALARFVSAGIVKTHDKLTVA